MRNVATIVIGIIITYAVFLFFSFAILAFTGEGADALIFEPLRWLVQ